MKGSLSALSSAWTERWLCAYPVSLVHWQTWCSMCTQCPNPAALTGVCCPTWGQSFSLCHLCKAGQCPCSVTQSLVGSLTFRSHCNVYVLKQSLHQLGGLWRLMPAGWGCIDLWPIFIVRGGIRSLSQSQGFAFSPPDSICAQSIPSLSVRAWPCCLPAQLTNRTKNCWGFLSSPVSDMSFSRRWVVLTCAGFSLLMVQAHWLQDLQHNANICRMNPTLEKLLITPVGPGSWLVHLRAQSLFCSHQRCSGWPHPFWGSDCQGMQRSLYCQPIWAACHGRLISLGKKLKDVSLLFWFSVPLQIASKLCPSSHWCLILTMGFSLPENEHKMFPWKWSHNTPSTFEFCGFTMLFMQNSLWWD